LILGLGAVGSAVARLAKAFGMRTIGVNRSGRSESSDVDEVRRTAELAAVLPQVDAIVLSLPLTEETEKILDAEAIGRLPAGAVLVNVGRGGVVDEDALIDALRSGHLAGAALDVFATEPLPEDSPLWVLPNVLLSPHTAGLALAENERIVALFTDNLRRYLRGEELINRIDTSAFY
jgi:phosphoglycerate dehydrogenase-like enzyme